MVSSIRYHTLSLLLFFILLDLSYNKRLVKWNIMLLLSFLSDNFVIGIMRTNERTMQKIDNNNKKKLFQKVNFIHRDGKAQMTN